VTRPIAFVHSCALLLVVACAPATGARGRAQATNATIDAVVIHPPLTTTFTCSEHPLGSEDHAGDALGSDCLAYRNDGGPSGNAMRFHTGDGTHNEDWFSWNESLLAPFDGVVRPTFQNPVTNRPGARGPDPASAILFQRLGDRADAPVQVAYVHVRDIQVKVGDTVRAGQAVARVGNSGNAMFPHVHVGAMRGDLARVLKGEIPDRDVVPLQVRFDLAAMGRLRGYVR
jgi:Peptidase family M23